MNSLESTLGAREFHQLGGSAPWCRRTRPKWRVSLENKRTAGLTQDEMIVLAGSFLGALLTAELTAHAQMDAEPEVVREVKEHLLATGLGVEQPLTGQELAESFGIRVAENPDFRATNEHL